MAIINSCLLCCCGPSAPIVLKAEANMSVVYGAFIPALQPIRATAACLCECVCGPMEHVSGSVQIWPCCCSLASRLKLRIHCNHSVLYRRATSVCNCVKCEGSSGSRWPTMQKICSELCLQVMWNGTLCVSPRARYIVRTSSLLQTEWGHFSEKVDIFARPHNSCSKVKTWCQGLGQHYLWLEYGPGNA